MSNLYVRLWSVSVALTLFGAARPASAADPIVHQAPLPNGMSWCDDSAIYGLFARINAFRVENKLSELRMDPLGMKDADLRAVQFAQYMASHRPGSPGFNPHEGWNTTAASLGYDIVSENLAFMTMDPYNIVYSIWQDSLHRVAMLASDANVAGVSCVYSAGVPYWTFEPGRSSSGSPAPQPPSPPSDPPPSNPQPPTPGPNPPSADETARFLTLINQYRAANGLNPLQISPTLTKAAEWMSTDMAMKSYASHTDSLGRNPGARLAAFGYTWFPYGENIAGGFADAQNTLEQWKSACDPDATGNCTYAHRKAMLSPAFAAIGIGRAYNASSAYRWYWVTDFGGYVDQGSTQPQPPPPPPPPPPPVPVPAPVIATFTANPSSIQPGQNVTLSWTVTGAASITIDNGIGTVTGLTSRMVSPAQSTTYRLTAIGTGGTSSAAVTVSVAQTPVADIQPPSAPTLVSAVAKSPTQVELAWTGSTDNVGVAGYQILRNGSPAAMITAGVLAYTDTTASNSAYTYTVRAFDAARNYSNSSNLIQVVTPGASSNACPAPVAESFTGCYYNNVTLTGSPILTRTHPRIDFDWRSMPSSPALGSVYSARWSGEFSLTAGDYEFVVAASDGVRLTIDGIVVLDRWRDQPEMFFIIRRAMNSGTHLISMDYYQRTGTPRAHLSWKTDTPAPAAPVITSFIATPAAIAAGAMAQLSWSVSGATSIAIDNGIGNVTGQTGRAVAPQQTTTYRLTAGNGAGQVSAAVTVVVAPGSSQDLQPPLPPVLVSAMAIGPNGVRLTWSAAADDTGIAGYRVRRNGSVVATLPGSTLTWEDATVLPGTRYTYSLQAFDAAGNQSLLSNSASLSTPAAPVTGSCTPAVNAFTGCYFANTQLSGAPVLVRTETPIHFVWSYTPPHPSLTGDFSVRWEGTHTFEEGLHTFYATASDGVRLYIDGTLVLDRWRDQPVYTFMVKRALSAGPHLITMEYYRRTGSPTAGLQWRKD